MNENQWALPVLLVAIFLLGFKAGERHVMRELAKAVLSYEQLSSEPSPEPAE